MSEATRTAGDATTFVGVVTVLYNSDTVLPDFFTSLAAQRGVRFRLYVIDNSACDSGTRLAQALAAQHGVDADCLFNDANVGVAKGNNQGIVKALAEGCTHVLLLNNDTVFEGDLLDKLLNRSTDIRTSMIVPKMMFFDPKHKIWCAGGKFNRFRAMSPVHFGEGANDEPRYNELRMISYAPTCCVLIERRVFETVGLMDPNYFVYYDDVDFMFRAHLAGVRMTYSPESVLYHKVGSLTGGKHSDFVIRYSTRNKVYFILKHYSNLPAKIWLTFYRILFLLRVLARRDSKDTHSKKKRAFEEGRQLYRNPQFRAQDYAYSLSDKR